MKTMDPMESLKEQIAKLTPAQRSLFEQRLRRRSLESASEQQIPLAAERGRAPLSFAQQRLWFLEQLAPGNPFYNSTWACRLCGPLDRDALGRALNSVVARHEALRTTFSSVSGTPMQVIAAQQTIELPIVPLSDVAEAERDKRAERLIAAEAERPFDLSRGPLLRATLLRLNEQEHVLLLTIHHIISDGWSMGVLIRELAGSYDDETSGKKSTGLPPLPFQYADFAVWQRKWLQGERLESQLSYWRKQLSDVPILELPTDRPRPPVQSFRGGRFAMSFPDALTAKLKELSQREGATLYMTLLAAFGALLLHYTGQEDLAVGSPIANRTRRDLEGLIGFFVNTLVMRMDLSGDPSFRDLLRRVREVALGAFAHQDLPFEKLVEELHPERDPGQNPFFQVIFAMQNAPRAEHQLRDLTLSGVSIERSTTRFDLEVHLWEGDGRLSVGFAYSTDLFDGSTVERMAGHFLTLLEAIAFDPDRPVWELPLLSEAERRQVVEEWNRTGTVYPREKTVHGLFEEQVEKTPDAVALVFGGERVTYRELNERANRLAGYLGKRGVGPEVLVGLCVERSVEMVVGLLGILKAGGAYVPLDPGYPRPRLEFMLEDTAAPVVLTQESLLESLPEGSYERVRLDSDWVRIEQESGENLESEVTADNPAYVIYTSGSTGKPKGVLVTHYNVVRLFQATDSWFSFHDRDVWTLFHSAAFDFSVWELWGALLFGGRLVVVPYLTSRSPEAFYELLCKEGVTVLNQTPSAFRQFAQVEETAGAARGKLVLRLIIFGGEALDLQSLRGWFTRHGEERPQLVNMYGITETTVHVTYRPLKLADLDSGAGSVIGRPIPDLQLYILDRHGEPVPIGVAGELYVGGAGVARGYLKRPELNAARFIPDPFDSAQSARLYRTGDLARRLPDGDVEYLGRIDQQVKIRGFRIELGEIETVLSSHPAVHDVVLLAREDGETDRRLVAYVVKTQGAAVGPSVSELREFLKQRLPDYMVPAAYVFLDSLPLTPNGKVDRPALPSPDQTRPELADAYAPPRTALEEVVAAIWGEVLGLERVGGQDNFFALGGHSLLATQVISRVRDVLRIELPLRALFESPSVAAMAGRIEAARQKAEGLQSPSIRLVRRDEPLPLAYAQEPLWFADQLRPGSASYNVPHAIRMRGVLNRPALQRALDSLVSRHETLRTTFADVEGTPLQIIAPPAGVALSVIDLSALPQSEADREVRRLVDEEVQRPFDLARGPLFRAALLDLGIEDQVLVVNMHHIISDAWSIGVMFKELSALYESFSAGTPSPLPEPPIQYADYAVWQREWLRGEVLERQVAYWKRQLAGAPPVLNLPTDRPRIPGQTVRGARQLVNMPKELAEELKVLSRREGVSLFMLLLAVFQLLLSRYTGETDIVVGTDVANRNRLETEGLIGFFINNVAARTDLSGDPLFRELLSRVREMALGAYAHQDLPFNKVVEALNPERRLSHNPVFQVLFVLQNAPASPPMLPGLTLTPIEIDSHTSKFDLAIFVEETDQDLTATWSYKTDLFEDSTISRMAVHFETLLRSCVARPDAPLSCLEMLTERERNEKAMETKQRQEAQAQKFRGVRRKALDLSQVSSVKTSFLRPDATMPLVLQPNLADVNLADWARNNLEMIAAKLQAHGAILFRGFGVSSPAEFERVAASICPELFGEYGDLPRESVSGNVYRSTPYPSDQAILFHNESSHMHRWPMKIWFYCVQAARQGGETPIVDIRKVYQRLNPSLRDRFREKKLMYVRNYIGRLDVSWQSFFQTTDKQVVEDYCRKVGLEFEWKGADGLRTRQLGPAIARHPATGEMVFFNQIQLHHVCCLEPAVRDSLLSMFPEEDLPRNVYYGDGSRIEDSVVAEIVGIYRELEVKEPWQEGDIIMLDNMLAAHARDPFVGPRKIVVSMGEIVNQQEVEW